MDWYKWLIGGFLLLCLLVAVFFIVIIGCYSSAIEDTTGDITGWLDSYYVGSAINNLSG